MLPYQTGISLAQKIGACVLCRHQPIEVGFLCQDCDEDMVWLPSAFEHNGLLVQSATFYEGAMARAIGAFKDSERLDTLPFLVHSLSKLAEAVAELDEAVILPIPTTDGRLVERGFFPVGILAQYLSAMTGFELYQGISRPTEGLHQRGLGRQERLSNLDGAFVLEYLPKCDTVILFDDVSTTGATFGEVAKVLLEYDPNLTIYALCLAHGSQNS